MSDHEPVLPPVLEPAPDGAPLPPPATSLPARLLNIFAVPNQVFDEVRASRHSVGNWLVPTILSCAALGWWMFVLFSMPVVQQRLDEQRSQFRARQTGALAESVKSGKATQAEVDQVIAMVDRFSQPGILRPVAAGGAMVWGIVRVFLWGWVLWFLARRFVRVPIGFRKALEVSGLATMIAVLGTVVTVLLADNLGKGITAVESGVPLMHPFAAFIIEGLDFWMVGLLGAGLARLTGVAWVRAMFLVLGVWLLSRTLLLLIAGTMMG